MKKTLLITILIIPFCSFAQLDKTKKENPYNAFGINLDIMAKNLFPNLFTVFYGVDVNFADSRLSRYLQGSGLTIEDKSVVFTPTKIAMKYIARVSSTGKEYLTVNYVIKEDKTKVPYIEGAPCYIIERVEITGDADIVIRIFVQYWDFKMTIGGYKRGELASYQVMGDYVILFGTNKPNVCKITIGKGNIEADYYTTFKIQ